MKKALFKTAHRWATARVAPTVLRFPFTVLLIAAAMAGCEKSDNNDPDIPTGPGIITFTAVPSNNNEIYFHAIAQQLVVDWGDGSAPETYTNVIYDHKHYPPNDNDKITHTYAGSNTYTVHIKGEGLTHFDCPGNQLTALDVRQCPALKGLRCESNQLTAMALNTVFDALPNRNVNDYARIYISNNPGANSCDKTIASNKGWLFF